MAKKAEEGDKRLGNQFWKLRSKHGRDKLFKTPELLWEAACEYFKWCDENPWMKVDHKGKDATQVQEPLIRPYTLTGLFIYVGCNDRYFAQFKKALPENETDFSTVIRAIEQIIYNQKFTGAAVGAFNANIIARDLGLSDKRDLSSSDGTMTPRPNVVVSDKAALDELNKMIDDVSKDETT